MKRITSIILASLILFTLCSCGGDSKDNSSSAKENSTSSQVTSNVSNNDSNSAVETGGKVSEDFFDDAVFIGDSVSLKLSYYADKVRENIGLECLGDAKFLCSGSLSFANSLWDINDSNAVHPSFQGQTYLLPDGVQATGAKKVFIMLGMNDFSLYGTDETIENAKTVINGIKEKNPDVSFYIQSVTPIISKAQNGDFCNANIEKLNEKLKQLCQDNGYKYLDVASALKDENGNLPDNYCSDPDAQGIHFTDEACEIWINYLEENVN